MSMETHREYIGYLYEWDGTEMLTDEEIVRCKNCKFLFENPIFKWFECERPMPCGDQLYILPKVEPDGFCAWGERRDASPCRLRHVKPDSWERIKDDAARLARGDGSAVLELVERCRRLAGEAE